MNLNHFSFFLSVRKYVYCKRGAKEATQIDTEKNNSPPYKRTQTTKRAQKKPSSLMHTHPFNKIY